MRFISRRQLEALQLAADGYRCRDIAEMWGYKNTHGNDSGPSHVRRVWNAAEERLGADNIAQAVAMAMRRGLIK